MHTASDRNETRILVVDDHALVRRGLVRLVDAESDLTVCAEAENAEEALEAVEHQRVDLAIVGNVAAAEKKIDAKVNVSGDAIELTADLAYVRSDLPVEISLGELLAAALAGEAVSLPQFTFHTDGRVDLAAIAQAMPRLLKIRQDVRVTDGELRIDNIVVTVVDVRGDKVRLVSMARQNAEMLLTERRIRREKMRDRIPHAVVALQRDLRLKAPPRRIACHCAAREGVWGFLAAK